MTIRIFVDISVPNDNLNHTLTITNINGIKYNSPLTKLFLFTALTVIHASNKNMTDSQHISKKKLVNVFAFFTTLCQKDMKPPDNKTEFITNGNSSYIGVEILRIILVSLFTILFFYQCATIRIYHIYFLSKIPFKEILVI